MPTPPLSVAVPSEVVPLKNWTVPVGSPRPGVPGATPAVRVTAWPVTDGLGEAATDVIEVTDPVDTVWVTAGEVLAAKLSSPEYPAVIVFAPVAVSAVVVAVATPLHRPAV